jgi:hypothetical protein
MDIHVARNGRQSGPFSLEEVRRQLAAGTLLPTDFGWTEGAAGWVPLGSFPGLTSSALPPMPPPPLPAEPGQPPLPVNGPPYFLPYPTVTSGAAVASLILGIISFTLFPIIPGIAAVFCGHAARSDIRRSQGRVTGDGMAVTGLVLGYIHVAILALGLIICAIVFASVGLPALRDAISKGKVPVFGDVAVKGKETKSLANAQQIVTACHLYALDHQEAFPKTLEELVPQYLPDRKTLVCPLSPGETVGYEYFGGTTEDSAEKILVMSKWQDWTGKRIVVTVGGSAEIRRPPPKLALPGSH